MVQPGEHRSHGAFPREEPIGLDRLGFCDPIVPVRYGSSPKYSKLRPRTGIRAMLTPGASNTCSARFLASVPITLPNSLATAGSNDAAMAIAEGSAVALAEDGSVYTETSTRSPPMFTKLGGT